MLSEEESSALKYADRKRPFVPPNYNYSTSHRKSNRNANSDGFNQQLAVKSERIKNLERNLEYLNERLGTGAGIEKINIDEIDKALNSETESDDDEGDGNDDDEGDGNDAEPTPENTEQPVANATPQYEKDIHSRNGIECSPNLKKIVFS